MNAKAVKAPPEVSGSEDLQPVEPEEVDEILRTIDRIVVEWESIQSKGNAISVTTPMTNEAPHRRGNGDA